MITPADLTMILSELLENSHLRASYFLRRTVPDRQANEYDRWRGYRDTRELVDKYLRYDRFDQDGLPQVTGIEFDDRYGFLEQPVIVDLTTAGERLKAIERYDRFVKEDSRRDGRNYKTWKRGANVHDLFEKVVDAFVTYSAKGNLYRGLISGIDKIEIADRLPSIEELERLEGLYGLIPERILAVQRLINACTNVRHPTLGYLSPNQTHVLNISILNTVNYISDDCYRRARQLVDRDAPAMTEELGYEPMLRADRLVEMVLDLAKWYSVEPKIKERLDELKTEIALKRKRSGL